MWPTFNQFLPQWRIFRPLSPRNYWGFLLRFLSATLKIPFGIIIGWISDVRAPRDFIFAETCAVHCKSLRGIVWYYAITSRRDRIVRCDFICIDSPIEVMMCNPDDEYTIRCIIALSCIVASVHVASVCPHPLRRANASGTEIQTPDEMICKRKYDVCTFYNVDIFCKVKIIQSIIKKSISIFISSLIFISQLLFRNKTFNKRVYSFLNNEKYSEKTFWIYNCEISCFAFAFVNYIRKITKRLLQTAGQIQKYHYFCILSRSL